LLQAFLQRGEASLTVRIARGAAHQHADLPHALGLLRTGGERPRGCCTSDKQNKFPSPHWPNSKPMANPTTSDQSCCASQQYATLDF
jgi:hypothetical protein